VHVIHALAAALILAASPAASAEPAAQPTAAPPAGPLPGADVVVILKDGQALRGRLGARDDAGVVLEVSGARIAIPAAAVDRVAAKGAEGTAAPWPRDPNRTRYLYSPTGFMLRQWEGYVSQTELVATSAAIGLTDWLTVQAGTVIPVLVYSPQDTPLLLALKTGGAVTPWLHLAAGFQTLYVPSASEVGTAGLLYGTLTLGTEDLNLGVSAGPPFALSGSDGQLGDVLVSISGTWRVARSIALVSENWIVPVEGETEAVVSGAVRFIGDRLGVDAGLLFVQGAGFPLPWLDFTWHWR
jgi:hypothetical protein